MRASLVGVVWCLCFVGLEAIQYVYFGGIFQRVSSFLFGFLVFGITASGVLLWAAWRVPDQLLRAFRAPGRPQGAFAEELMLDEIATITGVDPVTLREKLDDEDSRREMYGVGAELIGWHQRRPTGSQKIRARA